MDIAIIVVSIVLALGLVALFITEGILWHKAYPKLLPNGEPRPKQTLKEWLINHKPSKRRLIQIYAALLFNANIKGFISGEIYKSETTKYMCVPGLNCYSCPGAVGACPLGALQNALSSSKTRAPYYMLGILGIFGLIFARTICGFLCPVGLGQELLYKIRTPKLKKSRVTRVLSYFKYILLAVLVIAVPLLLAAPGFCKYICPAGTLGGAIALLIHPNNSGMFAQLGPLFTWKFCVLVAVVVASVFIYRFFCRFFCPLGAIYGFFNRIALVGVKIDKENCTECGLCISHCKMDVKRVGDHECINCGECISVCPTSAIRWKGSKIFLHGNEAALASPLPDEKPIGQGFMLATADTTAMTADGGSFKTDPPEINETPEEQQRHELSVTPEEQPSKTVKRPKKGSKFWVELTAWIVALAVLIGALVYYNAIDTKKPYAPPPNVETGYEIGNVAPDFTVKRYGSDESFNLYKHRGKVTIINFWATWCSGCVKEMPYFNELTVKHPEWNVIAIHGSVTEDVDDFIAKNWSDYTIAFAQDNLDGAQSLTYLALGGGRHGLWPMTVIVDEEGVIIYNDTTSFENYSALETAVLNAIDGAK